MKIALLNSAATVAYASQPSLVPPQYSSEQIRQMRAARGRSPQHPTDKMMTRSIESAAMLPYWNMVDDIMDGIEAMRLSADIYLPQFTDESSADYAFRVKLSKMTNVYSDIIEGLAAKPFEEPIDLIDGEGETQTPPPQIEAFVQDVDGSGNTMTVFAGATFFNAINSAIDWIFVDFSKRDPKVVTIADAKRAGVRPYWSHVLGRNVLNVQSKVVGGEEVLTYMKILEPGEPDHIREFMRNDDGVVTWRLLEYKAESTGTDTKYVEIDSGIITIGEIPLVPLVTGRRNGRSWKIQPAMKSAADLQVELFQQESDLKYAKKLTAFPMLAANGIAPQMEADGKTPKKIATGPSRVLYSTPDNATGKVGSWSYVEPSAESLKFLSDDVKETIQNLRELGKQPLTAQAGNITVITAAVAAGKAKSAVKAWAYKLKDTLENALLMTAKWYGIKYDPIVHVFVDFDEYMEGEDINALLTMSEKNKISDETLWEEAKRRGVLSSNFTANRERKRLLKQLPGDTEPDIEEP